MDRRYLKPSFYYLRMTGSTITVRKIVSEGGVTLVKSRFSAAVRFHGGYTEREARDIVPGDRVRFRKNFIAKDLSQVDIVLSGTSDRYVQARLQLMEQNNLGLWIPRLRTHLLRAIFTQNFDHNVFENKVLRQNDDFDSIQYRSAVDQVTQVIESYASQNSIVSVSWDTVSNWLNGLVIAPQEKRFFNALGAINPIFLAVAQDFTTNGLWAQAYEVYTTLRKIAMTYLARSSDHIPTSGSRPKPNGLSVGAELSELVRVFESDRNSAYLDVVVISNEEVRMKRSDLARKERFEPHLFKGLTRADDPNISVDQLSNYRLSDICGAGLPLTAPLRAVLSAFDFLNTPAAGISFITPEDALAHAKQFAIEHGFSFAQVRRLFDGSAPKPNVSKKEKPSDTASVVDDIGKTVVRKADRDWSLLSQDEKRQLYPQILLRLYLERAVIRATSEAFDVFETVMRNGLKEPKK